ncbi:MAG: ATP-binding protein, partial [Dehalococcoidia bacterium]
MSELPSGTVTLLFTDIEGSTQLLRRLGDRYGGVLAEHHRLLRQAFAAHNGHEVDTQGDSFFVAFSRPLDAVLAAARAQQALFAHPWPEGNSVRVRMGLHSGQPLLSEDGDRYLGLDVHQAARIEAAAHGGQVLLSAATAELLQARLPEGLELRSLGQHRLKDFEQLQPLFQLLVRDLPATFPPLRTISIKEGAEQETGPGDGIPALVGREAELSVLRERLTAAQAGHGSLVLLAGEPGIGKTRLAEELARQAAQQGVTVLWGRCWEGEGAPPFWLWREILKAYSDQQSPLTLRAELGSGAAVLTQLLPELRERLPDLTDPPVLEPEAARFRLFEAVSQTLHNAAQARPLLLLLDDLHWADTASLRLLQFLVQRLGDAPLLLVGTYRDTDLDRRHPLAEVLPSLRRTTAFERLLLHGLSREEVEGLMAARAGHALDAAGQRLAEALHRETEGNPFFIGEVLRHLTETGRLRQTDGRWSVAAGSIAELGIPEGVREVIGRRLSRLSQETNRLLTVASVIGREFDAVILERVAGVDADAVDAALEEAETAHVVERLPRSLTGCRFNHALIRETLREELPPRRRVRLHRQVGEALEQQYARSLDSHLSELAYHFLEGAAGGGDIERAIDYARRAAERALTQYAYEAAVRQYEAALALLDETEAADTVRRCDLLLLLAHALIEAGEPRRVLNEVAVAAFDLAEGLGDAERAGRACEQAWLALLNEGSGPGLATPEARVWAERAKRRARPGTAEQVRADLLSAGPLRGAGDWPGVVALLTRALEVARKLDGLELRWQAAWFWLAWVQAPRHAEARLQLAEE